MISFCVKLCHVIRYFRQHDANILTVQKSLIIFAGRTLFSVTTNKNLYYAGCHFLERKKCVISLFLLFIWNKSAFMKCKKEIFAYNFLKTTNLNCHDVSFSPYVIHRVLSFMPVIKRCMYGSMCSRWRSRCSLFKSTLNMFLKRNHK